MHTVHVLLIPLLLMCEHVKEATNQERVSINVFLLECRPEHTQVPFVKKLKNFACRRNCIGCLCDRHKGTHNHHMKRNHFQRICCQSISLAAKEKKSRFVFWQMRPPGFESNCSNCQLLIGYLPTARTIVDFFLNFFFTAGQPC